jgi:RNA-directed DNA polymerase
MNTIDELAASLLRGELRSLAASPEQHYKETRWEKKPTGGSRRIDEPRERLKAVQKYIADLLAPLIDSPIAYGIDGPSHVDAAGVHEGQPVVGKLDIEDFYPSVTADLVRSALRDVGFGGEALDLLVQLVTLRGRLPQGAPSSPAVANLVLARLDRRVAAEATRLGARVTRVADDFTLSGSSWIAVRRLQEFIEGELRDLGLRVNWRKHAITPHHRAQLVHGLTVNGRTSVPKRPHGRKMSRRGLRSGVRRARRYGASTEQEQKLAGRIGYAKQLHEREGQRLLDALHTGEKHQ